jgi:hypothetical protein
LTHPTYHSETIDRAATAALFPKSKLMDNTTFSVGSTHGVLTVDRQTGNVVSYYEHRDSLFSLKEIRKIDIEEWKRHHNRELPDFVDVLDVGFWYKYSDTDDSDAYEDPDATHRQMMAMERISDNCLDFFFQVNSLFQ